MNCKETKRRLKSWLDGELDAPTAARIEQHVTACFECRSTASDFRALEAAFQAAREAPMPLPRVPEILRRGAKARREEESLIRFLRRASAVAAAILLVSATVALSPVAAPGGAGTGGGDVASSGGIDDALAAFFTNLEPVHALSIGDDY